MGNTYFQFKQFTIQQSKATLKVCTESCLFGAYIPIQTANRILDIGTGTGVLALMLAQRCEAHIDAIEFDVPSFEDAEENFRSSPWHHRLHVMLGDIKTHVKNTTTKYDLIVCNPPFFIQHLKSPDARINEALHGSALQPADLAKIADQLINPEGRFYVLLPELEFVSLQHQFEEAGWKLMDVLSIHQKENQKVFRIIAGFSKTAAANPFTSSTLIIHQEERAYTDEFKKLLKPYYLHL
jgi:tRNA1Val (adenine37-N6)-methyltransferase